MTKISTVILDKSVNKLIFSNRGIFGGNIKEYELNQIKEIELSATYADSINRRSGGGFSYRLSFVLNNGETVYLNSNSTSKVRIMGMQIISEKTIGEKLAVFLGVPFLEKQPPSANEVLSAVSSTIQEAIKKEEEK